MSDVPTDPNARSQLKTMIVEITNCLSKIDGERQQIKEIVDDAAEKFDLKSKHIRKMATTMYKRDYANVVAENRHFEDLYETVVEGKK